MHLELFTIFHVIILFLQIICFFPSYLNFFSSKLDFVKLRTWISLKLSDFLKIFWISLKMPGFLKVTFPILYRTLETLKGMGPFDSFAEAETQAKDLGKYAGWSEFQQIVFQESIEEKADGKWGSKFVVPARNEIFEEVMRVPGLTEYIDVPTLFIQPQKGVNKSDVQIKPYHKYLRNLKMKKIPGNHWAFLVEPEKFNQIVAEFLESFSK